MTGVEIKEFLKKLQTLYPKFSLDNGTAELWSGVLSQYDAREVNEMFEFYASKEQYREVVPQVYLIVKSLTKISDKVDFTQKLTYCKFCKKAINILSKDLANVHEHEDRCSAIRHIERQYKRFNLGVIDKAIKYELYNMPENEFDEKYKKILKYVQEHTNQEYEKQLIENIFNPPSMEAAKNFLKS